MSALEPEEAEHPRPGLRTSLDQGHVKSDSNGSSELASFSPVTESTEAQRRVTFFFFFFAKRPSRSAAAMDSPRRVGLSSEDEDEIVRETIGNESESRGRS